MLDLFSQAKTIDMMIKFLRGDMQHLTPYDFSPSKPEFSPNQDTGGLERSTPEQEGIPSSYLEEFFQEVDACPDIRVHSILILRHGKIIADASWKPYSAAYPHMMFSLSKSVTGMAVGMAVREKLLSLDEKLVDIFPEKLGMNPFRSPRVAKLTVRHLLNMSSGIKFNEVGSETDRDWVRSYLQSDCSYEPGTEFSYNSMNSYMLSAIVCKRAGQSLTEYLTPRLFHPLGIDPVYWETCPMGIEKGGWGLYLRTVDMAKLGQLYLQNGRWVVDGVEKQLLTPDWVQASTSHQIETREQHYAAHYGYQLWDFNAEGAYQFNGVFGQYVIVLPKQDMVVAITSGSQELFKDDSCLLVEKYFGDHPVRELSDKPLTNNIIALRSLRKTISGLQVINLKPPKIESKNPIYKLADKILEEREEKQAAELIARLNGKQYRLEKSFGKLMPLILEGVTNNFSRGISQIAVAFGDGTARIALKDGEDVNLIEAGMDGEPRKGTVRINGDPYAVGSSARLTCDEDGRPVLKLYISFLETPCMRIMKFIFYQDRVLVRFSELPSLDAATEMLFGLVGGSQNNMAALFSDTIGQQKLIPKVMAIMKPIAKGKEFTPAKKQEEQNSESE